MSSSDTNITELYGRLGYVFEDVSLLEQALTHCSTGAGNNERLEFLGDAILGFIVAETLFKRTPSVQEGKMSQRRSALVNGGALAKLARRLKLGEYLSLSAGEKKSGGEKRVSILAGAMEAVMGAIYLDGGIEEIRRCILIWLGDELDVVHTSESAGKGPKSRLQEYMQAKKLARPSYSLVSISGKPHQQVFCVECKVPKLPLATLGSGSSRRKAEQAAAEVYLAALLASPSESASL